MGESRDKSTIIFCMRRPELRKVAGRGRTLWARGCYVSVVGLKESVFRRCIQRQEDGGRMEWARPRPLVARCNGHRLAGASPSWS